MNSVETPAFEGLDLTDPIAVLVKFHVSKEEHLPLGIRQVSRGTDAAEDMQHRMDALKVKLGRTSTETGRHRPGRVDTGVPVLRTNVPTHVGSFHQWMIHSGFGLTDVHWFEKPLQPGRKPSFVLVCRYEKGEETSVSNRLAMAVQELAASGSWFVHCWMNPGPVDTVNMTSRQLGMKPKLQLEVRDQKLVTVQQV